LNWKVIIKSFGLVPSMELSCITVDPWVHSSTHRQKKSGSIWICYDWIKFNFNNINNNNS
jgi:hypothetical protein